MPKEILSSLWLNEKEVLVYSELLMIWTSIASTLSSRTKINKSSVRYTCQSLEKKGLIFSIEKDNTFYYSAESPKRLLLEIENEKRKIVEKEKNISKAITHFESLKNKRIDIPKVTFYVWKDWMKHLYNNILDLRQPIDSFNVMSDMKDFFPEFVEQFIDERIKRKIYNRAICPFTEYVEKESKSMLRSIKMIDKKEFPFTWDIKICWNHVSIISSFKNEKPVAISITDKDIANNFKILFEYMWKKID